jgi:NAD(P)-dependent dehydrogenase (short-subunit alcohol dehydrogenase family)
MRELAGKTAFVTGGASGIGPALGRALAEAGMKVMLADIETDALDLAVKGLHNFGPDVRGVICDVSDADSVERAATPAQQAIAQTTPLSGAAMLRFLHISAPPVDDSDAA